MKNTFQIAVVAGLIFGGAATPNLHGQSFLVSNLDAMTATDADGTIATTFWAASYFQTGVDVSTLHSVVMPIENFEGVDEFISIYSNVSTNSVNQPNARLVSLGNPQSFGSGNQLRFTPDTAFEFQASTIYWMVLRAGISSTNSFTFQFTSSTNEMSNREWTIGDLSSNSFNRGNTWNVDSNFPGAIRFGIIPEPAEYALMSALMIGAFILVRRRMRIVRTRN